MASKAVIRSRSARSAPSAARRLLPALLLLPLLGCSTDDKSASGQATTQPTSRDPYVYQPHFDEKPNISGGDLGHFDRKAWKHDMDSLMNP